MKKEPCKEHVYSASCHYLIQEYGELLCYHASQYFTMCAILSEWAKRVREGLDQIGMLHADTDCCLHDLGFHCQSLCIIHIMDKYWMPQAASIKMRVEPTAIFSAWTFPLADDVVMTMHLIATISSRHKPWYTLPNCIHNHTGIGAISPYVHMFLLMHSALYPHWSII